MRLSEGRKGGMFVCMYIRRYYVNILRKFISVIPTYLFPNRPGKRWID